MKRFIFTWIFITILLTANAQEEETRYFNKDQLVIELFSNQWSGLPGEVKLHPRSLAFNLQFMFTFLGKNANVAVATGLGLLTENYYIDARPVKNNGELTLKPLSDDLNYSSNKLRFVTLELPLEVRIRSNRNSRNKIWKAYFGGKAGFMYQSMYKYNGDDPGNTEEHLKQKTFDLPYTEPLTYGVTARLGYDQIMVSAYYGLTNHFQKNKAPELYPLMVGVTLFLY